VMKFVNNFIENLGFLLNSSSTCSSSESATQTVLAILRACCHLAAPGLEFNSNPGAAK
jgi:hypothetical protein